MFENEELTLEFNTARGLRDGAEFERAFNAYETCRLHAIALGDRSREGYCLHESGLVLQARGLYQNAETSYHLALDIFVELDDKIMQGNVLRDLASNAQSLSQPDQVERYCRQSIKVLRQTGDRTQLGLSYVKLGIF